MSDDHQVDGSTASDGEHDGEGLSQRRIRHITSIQIRNLTPFPVRDAFTSALAQPTEASQLAASAGHVSDDFDVTLGCKRGRKASVNSGSPSKDDRGPPEPKARPRTASRVSFSDAASAGVGSTPSSIRRGSGGGPTIRPGNRVRTISTASSVSSQLAKSSGTATTSAAVPASASGNASFATMMPDNSQKGLERVISSRLVETFISVTVSPPTDETPPPVETPLSHSRAATPPNSAPPSRSKFPTNAQHKVNSSTSSSTSRKSAKASLNVSEKQPIPSARRESSASTKSSTAKMPVHSKSASVSAIRPTKGDFPSSSRTKTAPHAPSPLQSRPSKSPGPTTQNPLSSIPNYLSPIHRPSTNPTFPVDARAGYDFAEWTDLSGDQLRVEIWGKTRAWEGPPSPSVKGKEKQIEAHLGDEDDWRVLDEWNIHLDQLVPLPEDLASHPSRLPFNTPVFTLSPNGQLYYLPPAHAASSRSSSPAGTGYNSDPETDVRKVKTNGPLVLPDSAARLWAKDTINFSVPGSGAQRRVSRREGVRTAGWQDILTLVTVQSNIVDTEQSLSDIVRGIENILEADEAAPLRREVSERQAWVDQLTNESASVLEDSDKLRGEIAHRREQLIRRREMLELAREHHQQDLAHATELADAISDERDRLHSLRLRFPPTRTTLLTTLSSIYPIELLSPPDLLYTILSVPLPIPLSSSDPAPPLSLPAHKDVTEDAVATALGYVAQVVQLLAAYLGKGLVYPVTCVGSKSLIRDAISAMVGPRMFPLFSKGVDTYRFEYGVFLLNKDIELLMADRDLRALDMRHTLPNLKNLLLTLTDGDCAPLEPPRSRSAASLLSSSSIASLESPNLSPSSSDTTSGDAPNGDAAASDSPPASGSTTPTAAPLTPSESSGSSSRISFLGFSPLAGFLRGRYPSASAQPTVKSLAEDAHEDADASPGDSPPHDEATATGADDEDEDDRRTIRGAAGERTEDKNGTAHTNGHAVDPPGQDVVHEEKSSATSSPLPPSLPLTTSASIG
ncbi:hypothetical protein PLICRDRAFT_93773 [Plicaturopsis crispa FD-325 SS-3]|nr:hypothetical protein PLICRDRAFT_93773 [Plicaturopsis crispa FD-325 SS-3]